MFEILFQKTIPFLQIFDVGKAKEFYIGFLGFTIDWEHCFTEDSRLDMHGIEKTFYKAKYMEVVDPSGARLTFNECLEAGICPVAVLLSV